MTSRTRRRLLGMLAGCSALPLLRSPPAHGAVASLQPVIDKVTGGAPLNAGRVRLEVPRLADNGNAVPLKVTVESPMTATDYVKSIHLFSEKNPRPVMAGFYLGPRAGRAEVATRVRLNGAQHIVAVAALADGTFWSDTAEVVVTVSACYDGT